MAKPVLIKSTSGIRGIVGNGLDPVLTVQYGAAFGSMLKKGKVVVGRDSRVTGDMIMTAVISGLTAVGIDVIDVGIVPTPTVEIAVKGTKATGGICITASHNPSQWNALKFFNKTGEFITPAEYKILNTIFEKQIFSYQPFNKIGEVSYQKDWIWKHIKKTLAVKFLSLPAVKRKKFKVVVDAVNGAGSVALPLLLKILNVDVIEINCDNSGNFVHEPEPIPKNLKQLQKAVKKHKADLGMACDPDADRLALVDEKGQSIGEELTLALAVKEVLRKKEGNVVINLSTSKATEDIARMSGAKVFYSKVGEANVVQMMHAKKALVGGEGNGGVILPYFHAGRDSLIAAALILSCLANEKKPLSKLVETLPKYYTIKTKVALPNNFKARLLKFGKEANKLLGRTKIDRRDGLRFDFADGWVQVRTSNTEPIFRLIVETNDQKLTDRLTKQVLKFFR